MRLVFPATIIDANADGLIAWGRDIAALKRSEYVLAIGRFSNPRRMEDVAALALDESGAKQMRTSWQSRCSTKLSDDEIVTLQRASALPRLGRDRQPV